MAVAKSHLELKVQSRIIVLLLCVSLVKASLKDQSEIGKAHYEVIPVTKPVLLGEGPHWDVETQTLFFVDLFGGSINSYKPATNEHHTARIGDGNKPVTLIVPIADTRAKRFVISMKNDLVSVYWDGMSENITEWDFVAQVEDPNNTHRLNDGKADPNGRLWAGTMGKEILIDGKMKFEPGVGSLYTIEFDKRVVPKLDGITISNGITWNSEKNIMYFIDSEKYRVDCYNYEPESGKISNFRTVFDFITNEISGLPDGMTIDTDGILYVANYGGSEVLKINPDTGVILLRITIPTPEVTSVAFGGRNLDELYVTTANVKKLIPGDQNAGRLYKIIKLGVKGLPAQNVHFTN